MDILISEELKEVLKNAKEEAHNSMCNYIGTEHVLISLLKLDCIATRALKNLDVELESLTTFISQGISNSDILIQIEDMIPFTPRLKKTLERSAFGARLMNQKYIGTEHVLLSLLADTDSAAGNALVMSGIELESTKAEIHRLLGIIT